MAIRKHWIRFVFQISRLYLQKKNDQTILTTLSYNKISLIRDKKFTDHMNTYSGEMIGKITFPKNGRAIDLTCGSGYVTGLITERFTGEIIGVDLSTEMLKIAQEKLGEKCRFVCCDALGFLKSQPSESADIITCAWGLGYLKPSLVFKEVLRVLKPGGQVAIIDDSLFSLYEVVFSGFSTLAEYPASLNNVMNARWLSSKRSLIRKMRRCGLHIISSWKGKDIYFAKDEKDAIDFLLKTGSTSGFRFCIDPCYAEIIKQRFGEIFKKSYATKEGLPITHRFIAAIAKKPKESVHYV